MVLRIKQNGLRLNEQSASLYDRSKGLEVLYNTNTNAVSWVSLFNFRPLIVLNACDWGGSYNCNSMFYYTTKTFQKHYIINISRLRGDIVIQECPLDNPNVHEACIVLPMPASGYRTHDRTDPNFHRGNDGNGSVPIGYCITIYNA